MKFIIFLFSFFYSISAIAVNLHKPITYSLDDNNIDIKDYYLSQKYDGIRAYWDGETLKTATNKVVNIPESITKAWPKTCLDGELWLGKSKFSDTVSLLNSKDVKANLLKWQKLKYMVFDQPCMQATFSSRLAALRKVFSSLKDKKSNLTLIEQKVFLDKESMQAWYEQLIATGAEGVILRKKNAAFSNYKPTDFMKLKPISIKTAVVLKHITGKKSLANLMGSLLVKDKQTGLVFKIGTGFTAKDRANPPAVGAMISYKHSGYTKNNLPKFPVFLGLK